MLQKHKTLKKSGIQGPSSDVDLIHHVESLRLIQTTRTVPDMEARGTADIFVYFREEIGLFLVGWEVGKRPSYRTIGSGVWQ